MLPASEIYVNMVDLSRMAELDGALELMYFGFRKLVEDPDRLLARRGMNRSHHRILYFVARGPGLTMTELLDALAITKQALHRPLRDLERRRLVRIVPDERDGRARRIALTPGGAELEAALTGLQRARLERIFSAAGSRAEVGWRSVMALMGERRRKRGSSAPGRPGARC